MLSREKRSNTYVRLAILALGIVLLAFVDMIVLERIYKPISTEHSRPEQISATTNLQFSKQINPPAKANGAGCTDVFGHGKHLFHFA